MGPGTWTQQDLGLGPGAAVLISLLPGRLFLSLRNHCV